MHLPLYWIAQRAVDCRAPTTLEWPTGVLETPELPTTATSMLEMPTTAQETTGPPTTAMATSVSPFMKQSFGFVLSTQVGQLPLRGGGVVAAYLLSISMDPLFYNHWTQQADILPSSFRANRRIEMQEGTAHSCFYMR